MLVSPVFPNHPSRLMELSLNFGLYVAWIAKIQSNVDTAERESTDRASNDIRRYSCRQAIDFAGVAQI